MGFKLYLRIFHIQKLETFLNILKYLKINRNIKFKKWTQAKIFRYNLKQKIIINYKIKIFKNNSWMKIDLVNNFKTIIYALIVHHLQENALLKKSAK